ncbi:hypothetical protein BC829DRAFT_390960 [Chytridium lagenaria]|nr:hypothetical protein BC829DRAFT_390960 [Chytridium lagenaria]
MMSWPHEPYSDWQGDIPRPAPPPVAPMDPRPRTWDPRSRPPPPFHPSEPLRREDMDASTHPSLQRYWSHYPYDERFQPFPPYAYPYRHPYAAPSYWPPGVRPPSSHRSEGSFDDRSKDDDDHSLHRRHLSDGSLVPEKPDTVTTPAPDASSSTAEPIPDEPLITVPGSSKTSRRRVKPQDTPQVHVSSKPLKRKISPKIEAAIAAEPSLSPQDPQPPHSRTRFRKMTEVDVRCSSSNCGARNMALCILHGTPTTPTSTTATCAQCLGAQQSDDETLKRKRSEGTKKRRVARRKESDEEDDIAEGSNDGQMRSCSLCKGVVGEIRFNMEGGGEGDFQCRHKYSFCTECGGGGRYRTGKWRPQELFSFGRRTCSLSHIRIGTAPLDFEVFALPNERNAIGRDAASLETFLAECKEVFEDCLYATAAVPEMMEKPNSTSLTFTDVEAKVLQEFTLFSTSIRTEFSLPASTTSPTSPNSPRRYLATSCIPQTRRKRGRIVAADDDDQPVKSSSNRTLVACAMAEYAPSIGLLTIKNLTIRVPTLQQGAIDGELICAFLDRVEKDDADIDITHAAVALTSIITPQASPGALRTKLRRPLCVGIRVPVQYPKWITQLARLGFAEREVFEGKVEGKAEGVDGESVTEVFATFEEVRIATLSKIHKKAVSASRLKKSALKD